ncbi:LacI family DNA-binding transcriptional regulator [Occultella gossypii]|uniref:LacI family DNA-binding transcriptional regulator n=1 Tax=Occultella gossypii TaxID=2800820 RepID=A0ABS7S8G4_9MICO|nr:LacI family DNA-binding transcriptional regulator [Occultella gossypii]MBZ2196636.1 LacI family DNA-binding transcriptional regulator [Occultella gossypii]
MRPPGARGATLKDVADRVGVHPGTVSRALNPATQGMVNPDTVRKVQRAAKELAYRPNPMARGLKTSRSMTVGIIVPDITNPLFPPIVKGAEAVLTEAGYTCLIGNTDNDIHRERDVLEAFIGRQVDGLIVASAQLEDEVLRHAADGDRPLVLVNRRVEGARIPLVVGDDAGGMEMAVRHLAELGHTRIAHLAGPQFLSTGRARARAFRQSMHEFGLTVDPSLVLECATYSVEAGAAAAAALFEATDAASAPTAIACGNDQIAIGTYDVMRERGLRCPEDVSVVGYNDMPYVDKLAPPLTTIRVPHPLLGAEAARIMLRLLTGEDTATSVISLPVELVVRGSTAPPR